MLKHYVEMKLAVAGTDIPLVYTRPDKTRATIVIAHGAGTGMEHPFLVGLSTALTELNIATLRFEFPYRARGRKVPGNPAEAISTWKAVMAEANRFAITSTPPVAGTRAPPPIAASAQEPIWAAGKSYGGRMASMAIAEGMPASGLILLGYPLHPPGKPDLLRDEHLYRIACPMLFIQGRNDPFAVPNETLDTITARIGDNAHLNWLAQANHSFEVKGNKRPALAIGEDLAATVASFIKTQGRKISLPCT